MVSKTRFELIFEGTNGAPSPKLKAELMTSLNLSSEKVAAILERAPIVIRKSTEQAELEELVQVLTQLNANVRISALAELESEDSDSGDDEMESTAESDEASFEFEMELDEAMGAKGQAKDSKQRVYDLSDHLNEDEQYFDSGEFRGAVDDLINQLKATKVVTATPPRGVSVEELLKKSGSAEKTDSAPNQQQSTPSDDGGEISQVTQPQSPVVSETPASVKTPGTDLDYGNLSNSLKDQIEQPEGTSSGSKFVDDVYEVSLGPPVKALDPIVDSKKTASVDSSPASTRNPTTPIAGQAAKSKTATPTKRTLTTEVARRNAAQPPPASAASPKRQRKSTGELQSPTDARESHPQKKRSGSTNEANRSRSREDLSVKPKRVELSESEKLRNTVKLLLGSLLAVVISLVIVGIVYLTSDERELLSNNELPLEEIVQNTERRSAEQPVVHSEALDENANAIAALKDPSSYSLFGSTKFGDHEVTARILVTKGKISDVLIDVTTPPPPELTPEEIVARVERRPWLYRARVAGLDVYEKSDGSFLAEGSAKITIDHLQDKHRVAAQATLRGKVDHKKHLITASLTITRDKSQISDKVGTSVVLTPEGFYQVFVRTEIVANTIKPPEAFRDYSRVIEAK